MVVIPEDKSSLSFFLRQNKINVAGPSKINFESNNINIDLYFATEENFESIMLFLRGSQEFNVKTRIEAKKRGWKLNQYGLFEGDKLIASKEREILEKLGFGWIEPEDRY